jgi:hypothetical protein
VKPWVLFKIEVRSAIRGQILPGKKSLAFDFPAKNYFEIDGKFMMMLQ